MFKDSLTRPARRAAEPRTFGSWSERAALHAASFGTPFTGGVAPVVRPVAGERPASTEAHPS